MSGSSPHTRIEVILLGITIDNELVFKKHIENLCRTAQYKLHALTRIRKYLTLDKAVLLGNTFINSQFNYAPLIWMFSRKTLYHKIEKIHHRTLKVIYHLKSPMKISYWKVVQFLYSKDICLF